MSAGLAEEFGTRGVTVRYSAGRSGSVLALDAVTALVSPGEVLAVVGGDGAGKSTLLRTIVGRVGVDDGSVLAPPKEQIGYLPAASNGWLSLSVKENMAFAASAYGLPPSSERADALLEAADLTGARDRLAGQLSGGMKRKLGFAMAAVHDPRLLVLDEPSTGVDPVSRVELWKLVAAAAASGAAVIMATTYLDEAERATRLVVLDRGRSILSGQPATAIGSFRGTITAAASAVRPEWSWRRGRDRHEFWPEGAEPSGLPAGSRVVAPDLEDITIALSLAGRSAGQSGGIR